MPFAQAKEDDLLLDVVDLHEFYHIVSVDVVEVVISEELADSIAVVCRLEEIVGFFTLFNEFREHIHVCGSGYLLWGTLKISQ